jgi:hypothetical protein
MSPVPKTRRDGCFRTAAIDPSVTRRRKALTPVRTDPLQVVAVVCRALRTDGVSSIAALISRAGLAGTQRAVIDPVDHQPSLPEVPMTVHLHKLIQVPD